MIGEQMKEFITGLIKKTKSNDLQWIPLILFAGYREVEIEVKDLLAHLENHVFERIIFNSSYILEHNNGYIVLCNVSFFIQDTDIRCSKLFLLTKINPSLPLMDSGNYPAFQEDLEKLKLFIERNLESEYHFPDDLYRFWSDIIEDK